MLDRAMPREHPFLRRDSNKEYHRFLRKVMALEEEKAEEIARGKEAEAQMLREAAEEVDEEEQKHELETAARAKEMAADEWRRGMGLPDSEARGGDGEG